MFAFLVRLLITIRSRFTRRTRLEAENLILRQQLAVLRRRSATRVRLWNIDRLLIVWLYRLYPSLLAAVLIVRPETGIRWHRRGFRAYWPGKSRHVGGRPRIDSEIRALIRRMSRENPLSGAPRIHGELLMLGIEVAESTVSRYMVRCRRPPSQGWKTFLRNHAAGIASLDLFVVRTISFKLLYGLVILRHARRRLVMVSFTTNPTAEWIAGQVTDAFPWDEAPSHLIRDRDGAFGPAYIRRIRAMGIRDHPTAARSPWQNGHVERLIGRESLDPRFYHGIDKLTGLTTRNVLAAPLQSHQGMTGVVEIVNKRGAAAFTDDDASFIEGLSSSIAIAIENARLYEAARESEARLRTQVGALRRDLARHDAFAEIVGTGSAMVEVLKLMETAAASSITALIEGETGTGKELVARGIHRVSARSGGPFLALNCAAMPEPLLESELFGHRRGAFTGAIRDNPGLFRAAAGGVIFLDEVADMPMPMQAKLLRVLEEQEVVPLGDFSPLKVDVRVLSATNRDLKAEVAGGRFREDLYYRLAVFPISLPPLHLRREDIPLLATRFLAIAAEQQRKPIAGLEPAALELLTKFDWPGNVRQLRNEIERAVALARNGESVAPEHLSAPLRAHGSLENGAPRNHPQLNRARGAVPAAAKAPAENQDAKGPLRRARAAFEADYIAKVLDSNQGNVSRAAQALGLSRASLQKKMKEYSLR